MMVVGVIMGVIMGVVVGMVVGVMMDFAAGMDVIIGVIMPGLVGSDGIARRAATDGTHHTTSRSLMRISSPSVMRSRAPAHCGQSS